MNRDSSIYHQIANAGLLAVLEILHVEHAVPVAKALVKGGITAIELALRTEAAEESIYQIAQNVPEMLIGVGTVIKAGQAKRVKELGAHFAVSPGFNPNIVKESVAVELPFAPGISTPSELEGALELGCEVLKLFPAEPLGGVKFLESMTAPYSYLGLKFIPLGGINLENLLSWAKNDKIIAVGGTWIAKKELILNEDWDLIASNASEAMSVWKTHRR